MAVGVLGALRVQERQVQDLATAVLAILLPL